MLIELPSLQEYSMQDCQDLFMSAMDDDLEIDACSMFVAKTRAQGASCDAMVIDDAPESFLYSSSSESDADVCFSDIEIPKVMLTEGLEKGKERSRSIMSLDKQIEYEIALHSPGKLLGTPRDSSRRYEYPFPAHVLGDLVIPEDGSSSTATTPGLLTPGLSTSPPRELSSSLGLQALAPVSGLSSRSASLPMYMSSVPAPAPVPVLGSSTNSANHSHERLAPLSQSPPVPGPMSAPVLNAAIAHHAAHPKLSRFNPANTPVPPGLRGRKHKSASVSVPQAQQPSAGSLGL